MVGDDDLNSDPAQQGVQLDTCQPQKKRRHSDPCASAPTVESDPNTWLERVRGELNRVMIGSPHPLFGRISFQFDALKQKQEDTAIAANNAILDLQKTIDCIYTDQRRIKSTLKTHEDAVQMSIRSRRVALPI